MSVLTPLEAGSIAHGVYNVRKESKIAGLAQNRLKMGGLFGEPSRFEGKSGPMWIKELSGFGYIATGTGQYAGDILIATRGTDTALDWLTDFNIGVHYGSSGTFVHAGFHDTWKSFLPAINEFLRGRNPRCIHCVGHSLGGALAFLNADYITANRIAEVKVYTFGAPRTGVDMFAKNLTERVGRDNIYRVSNPCDPVPMIPIFPFFHAPYLQEGLQIARTRHSIISGGGHKMEESYLPSLVDKDWGNLRVSAPRESEVKGWIQDGYSGLVGGIMGSSSDLERIAVVMSYLLKLAVVRLGIKVTAAFTVADQVAALLMHASQLSKEIKSGVMALLKMIFKFLGRTVTTAVELTSAFLRWVLDLLMTSLRSAAHRALSMLG